MHWHVDYLKAICPPAAAWFAEGNERQECQWVNTLAAAGAAYPIPAFGASDCRTPGCQAHLLRLPPSWRTETLEEILSWTTRCLLPF
jgi:Uri superfamily endonuclease